MSTYDTITCDIAMDLAPLYVLGALEAQEAAQVRRHLATCKQTHDEFAELGGVVPYLADAIEPVEPPAELKQRVLAAVRADIRAATRDDRAAERLVSSLGVAPTPRALPPARRPDAPALGLTTDLDEPHVPGTQQSASTSATAPAASGSTGFRSMWQPAMTAAAVVLAVTLGALNFGLQRDASAARERAALLRDAVVASTAADASVARIAGSEQAPSASGFAVLPPSGPGYLVISGLAPAPSGKTYQAWYLGADAPRSAGLVQVEPDGLAVLTGLTTAADLKGMGLTVETAGGALQPTMPIVAAGELAPRA